ncbi:MAG: T9SS type A sorting domain-containing protein [Chitinophagaceae bacterium]|nr:T9SS type A sorting domain-containing protein [Chitinophagaceae bacterium]
MKKVLLVLVVNLFHHFVLNAQLIRFNPATSVGFGTSPWTPPALLAPGLSTTGLIRGSSILTSGTPAGGCYGGSGGWAAGALDANSFSITISAACDEISISSIAGFTRRSGTGPNGCAIYYSLNGAPYVFAGNWTTTSTSGTTGTAGSTVLSSVTALQNIPAGTTIKFLINPTGSATGNWYFTNTSLAINGTTVPVVAPAIATSPSNAAISAVSGTSFSVSGVTAAASYQWQRNMSGLSGGTWVDITSATMDPVGIYSGYAITSTATGSTLVLAGVPAGWDGYAYRCVVTNCAGTAVSSGALLNVVPSVCSGLPAGGTALTTTTNLCGSGSTTLSLSGATIGGVTYQWSSSTVNVPPGTDIPGATSSSYSSGTLTDTTYFWCTTTCPTSSLSSISSSATVLVHSLPVVTASGGVACSGGSGATVTAVGAASYSWSPSTALSATTGASVVANPTSSIIYTVTGTDVNGCSSSDTALVKYAVTPATVVVSPSSYSLCQASAPYLITATGGTVGPTTVNSGVVSIPTSISAFGTISSSVAVAGVPAGAVITGMRVNLISFGSQYQDDYVVNIKAPNGNVLNLINQRGTHTSTVTALFSNTELSSSGVFSLATGSGTFSGSWMADVVSGVGGIPNISNIGTWSGLYSTPNGTWTISIYNNTGFSNVVLPTMQWSVTIEYSYAAPTIWTPTTGLFTDASGTIPYTGSAVTSVYFNPLVSGVVNHSVVADNDGCLSTANTTTTVNPIPNVISGPNSMCTGTVATFSNDTVGGVWSVSNANGTIAAATGLLTAVSAGPLVITYTLASGCFVTKTITINSTPSPIGGALSVCEGLTTLLSNALSGGVWSSASGDVSVDMVTGVVIGLSAGTAMVSYSQPSGCHVTSIVTVNQSPSNITGVSAICTGTSGELLTNAVTGGTWSSSSSNLAIGSSSGILTGLSSGSSTVLYTLPNGCNRSTSITVNPSPAAITGPTSVCVSGIANLGNTTTGGTWSVSNTNATIIALTGQLTGSVSGTAIATYSLPTGCSATMTVSINPLPSPISGMSQVCIGSTVNMVSTPGGGTWDIAGVVATVGSLSGVVTGVATGGAQVTYSLPTGCKTFKTITVNGLPAAITGSSAVCLGYSVVLSSLTTGGTWSASNANVSIGAGSGVVTGMSPGTVSVTYTLPTSCNRVTNVTVNPLPSPIAGPPSVCLGSNVSMSNSTPGGVWSSSNTTVASIDPMSGVLTGLAPGASVISYTIGSGCAVFASVSVTPLPPPNTGIVPFCSGASITLSNPSAGGTWSSGNPLIAVVGASSGVVTGLNGGIANITYTAPSGCSRVSAISVNPTPSSILAVSALCTGNTTVLHCATPGGVWISSNTGVAVVAATGPIAGATTGISAGIVRISYILPSGCFNTTLLTINPTPAPVFGSSKLCVGSPETFYTASTDGYWDVSTPSIATVHSGVVIPLAVGSAVISYVFSTTGCFSERTITVNPLPLLYPVSGGGAYCAGAGGATVYLSGSQTAVRYRIASSGAAVDSLFGTGSLITFNPISAPGVYSVSALDTATGCSRTMASTATITSVLTVAPSVTIARSSLSPVCEGTSMTFLASIVNGGSSPILAWRKNGIIVGSGTSYSYLPGDEDVIKLSMISNAACLLFDTAVASDTLQVYPVVNPYIGIAAFPNDTVCRSTGCTFVAGIGYGGTSPAYQWFVNGVLSGTGPSFSAVPANNDVVLCKLASNAVCASDDTVSSNNVKMSVVDADMPVVAILPGTGTSISAGQSVVFTASVTGVNPGSVVTYQWYVNGLSLPGEVSSTFTSNTLTDQSKVSCEVTASGRCGVAVGSGTVTINVRTTSVVFENSAGTTIRVWPNPSNGQVHVYGNFPSSETQNAILTITDNVGRQVYSSSVLINAGRLDSEFSFPEDLPAGVYVLSLSTGGITQYHMVTLIK